ncbi:MAG: formylglycine-generating enzyme family protein, partial [Bacteroidaceae bacterium]|nr:formylglycine-generating enzyme family protein [Bacteroidaceae bacterium]
GGKKWWFIGIAAAVLCAVIVLVALGLGKSGLSQEPASEQSEFNQKPLSNRTFTVNGVEFSMVEVEGGTFEMGSNDGDDDEKPVHSVTLSSYYIGQTEVTQALWKAVMGSNPSYFKGDNLPVEQVSWDDCQSFITKLNQLTGERFRLPTEAEWEFAARAGTKTSLYYNGQDIVINGEYNSPNLDPLAWYGGNCGRNFTTSEGCDVSNGYDISDWPDKQYSDSKGGTHSVGRKQPNAFGLYDMLGNVWEWCQDWYGDYSSSSQTNPTGPTSGSYRVLRGGSWRSYVGFCLSADRDFITPGDRCIDIGLRLVLSE